MYARLGKTKSCQALNRSPGRVEKTERSSLWEAPQQDCLRQLRWRAVGGVCACWNRGQGSNLRTVPDRYRISFAASLAPSAAESIVNEIRRFELFTDGRSAQVALTQPDLIIERSRLIPALARSAQQAGASSLV